jgi:HD-GYP domain-containing protein (c-di-GMP phosphodiesterase class II)
MYNTLFVFTEQMAGALIEAVDAKDPYTRGHSDRVNYYAMQLGKARKLSDAELQALYWASLLHDVGKIAVPDMVLSKLGKLDDDEYTLMKMHSERGHDILKNIAQLQTSLPGMRHHHERFDGEGYPHGLVGVDIPLHARIIAIADTYDAITSSRSYRPARSHEQAMDIVHMVAGTQLDPDLVAIWSELMNTCPAIYQKKLTFPAHQ